MAVVIASSSGGILRGFNGNDVLIGRGGDDIILANGGDDRIFAGGGDDSVSAGAGNDLVNGDAGDDDLRGGEGNDHLFGGSGDDVLAGQDGADILTGGTGADVFVLSSRYDAEGGTFGTTITDLDFNGDGDGFFLDGFSGAVADAGLLGQRITTQEDFVDFVNAAGGATDFQGNSVSFTVVDDDGDSHSIRVFGFDEDDFAEGEEEGELILVAIDDADSIA